MAKDALVVRLGQRGHIFFRGLDRSRVRQQRVGGQRQLMASSCEQNQEPIRLLNRARYDPFLLAVGGVEDRPAASSGW